LVTVAQQGCSATATFPGEATATGTISGNSFTYSLQFAAPCTGTGSGSATLAAGAINGTYQGTANGPGCCGVLSGSFTLRR
jgi:hypothetical protein